VFVPRYKLIKERGRNDTLKSLPWTHFLLSVRPRQRRLKGQVTYLSTLCQLHESEPSFTV